MSLKAFLDGYRAARNGQSWRTEPPERPWRQDARTEWEREPPAGDAPQWGNEPVPPESELAELEELLEASEAEIARLKDEHLRAMVDCEVLRRDIAARDAELAECQAVVSELWDKDKETARRIDDLTTELARVKETRDRYQTNGKAAAAAREAARERVAQLESVLKFRGVKKALLKAVHPDMHPGASEGERRALDQMSRTVNALYDSME